MPVIGPPPNTILPVVPLTTIEVTQSRTERVLAFMDVKPWICSSCGLKNFGRNEACASYKCRAARPNEYREEKRDV